MAWVAVADWLAPTATQPVGEAQDTLASTCVWPVPNVGAWSWDHWLGVITAGLWSPDDRPSDEPMPPAPAPVGRPASAMAWRTCAGRAREGG